MKVTAKIKLDLQQPNDGAWVAYDDGEREMVK